MGKKLLAFLLTLAMLLPLGNVLQTEVSAVEINTYGRKTYNMGLSAIPAPGPVTIDGDLDEWDWSGRSKHYPDYEFTDIYYCESAYMWDKDNLYLAYKFTDTTPAMSITDPNVEPGWTWRGDCVQLRIISDRPTAWVTIAYYDKTQQASLHIRYPDEEDEISYVTDPGDTKLVNLTSKIGFNKLECYESELKYKVWEEGGGYNMEMKIPWKMLYLNPNVVQAGLQMTMHTEIYWGDLTGQNNRENAVYDNFNKRGLLGSLSAKTGWGLLTLESHGNLPLKEYVHNTENGITGTIHIPVKVPKHAKKVTLVLEDKFGKRIANTASEVDVESNIIGEEGDNYVVDTIWDGTGLLGEMVSPGEYTVRGIYHDGITPYFDFTAYNPGNPPWPDSRGVGSWGSDHLSASSITSIGDMVFIGYRAAESGTGLFALTPDGKKKWGLRRGAEFLTSNSKYLYSIPGSDVYAGTASTGNAYLMRVDAETGKMIPFKNADGTDKDLLWFMSSILDITKGTMPEVGGLAANDKHLVMTTKNDNKSLATPGLAQYGARINVLNLETGEREKAIPVSDVGDAAFGKNGLLYAVTGKTISEINVETGKVKELPIKAADGGEFSAIAVDNTGNIVVFDKGEDKQLKVYSLSGQLLYTVGKKGGRELVGKWDPDGFTGMVSGVTVDSNGLIWVTEQWNYPRRISCWNKDGLVKDYIGNPGYMAAGGSLDEDDENVVFVGGNKITVDKENMTYAMDSVLWVPDCSKGEAFAIGVTHNGRVQHFSTEINGQTKKFIYYPSTGMGTSVLYRYVDEYSVKPFFAMGRVCDLKHSFGGGSYEEIPEANLYYSDPDKKGFAECYPGFEGMPDDTQYIWNDYDYDGAIEYDECEFIFTASTTTSTGVKYDYNQQPICTGWGNIVSDDMKFITTDQQTTINGYLWTPDYFTEDGLPRYSKGSAKLIQANRGLMDWDNVITPDGKRLISIASRHKRTSEYYNGVKVVDLETGEDLWWYKNEYPGVHGGQSGPIPVAGQIVGPIKQMGTVTVDGVELFALRGYFGADFFFTTDGFYIQTVYRDGRIPMQKMPDDKFAAKNMDMSKMSENGEPWSGCMVAQPDGNVRLLNSTGGPTIICSRIEGLDTIEYIEPFKITVTKQMLEEAEAYNRLSPEEKAALENGGQEQETEETSTEIEIYKTSGDMTIDGSNAEWDNIQGVNVTKTGVAEIGSVKLAYDDKNLYALYEVQDSTPMKNLGNDIYTVFKTGDSCDINISPTGNKSGNAADGDLRIYMTELEGKPTALLLKQKTSGAKKPYTYSSPVTSIPFDYAAELEEAEIKIVKDEGASYTLEARIPLESLGIIPGTTKNITGDVGIITSDETGVENKARIYFYNQDTNLVKDIPSEVRLMPGNWGKMTFK